jgi:murein DD-endopeptidase MepM/ murein hydrolase activator NlpD
LPNAMAGVQRAIARLRSTDTRRSLTVRRLRRRAFGVTRRIVDLLVPVPTHRPKGHAASVPRHLASHRGIQAAHDGHAPKRRDPAAILHSVVGLHPRFRGGSRLRLQRRLIRVRLGGERALPMGIALAVIVAGAASIGQGVVRPVGAAQAEQELRLSIGGQNARLDGAGDFDVTAGQELGSYVDDGTFYKPVAVDTSVESGSSLLRHYTVKAGDTLTGVASQFGVSMMTLWWANRIDSKDALHQGQVLIIPPVNGLVITVAEGDTLEGVAAKYEVDPDAIMQLNELSDPTLVVGQVLILPGAKGAPIPEPKPTTTTRKTTTTSTTTTKTYGASGTWSWPVPGGYISQYFHYGHYGVDIAAPYGTRIIAARGGTIAYASWNSDGCGYEVTIYIGSNLYVQNCHMSSIGVHVGQSVSRGQYIGRVGSSGWASGPHDHFAVSVGRPFTSGAYFINPLRYY